MPTQDMTTEEIDQFLVCARVGRLGLGLPDGPYVVPVGYAYANGKVFFHTCSAGQKMSALRGRPRVCFEVDEALSDGSMYKSVVVFGTAEILDEPKAMIPYLQALVDKYRVSASFDEYMAKPGRNRAKELAAVRICVITPTKVTGRRFAPEPGPHARSLPTRRSQS
jgi:nitroimidazol reductase NimA-like FMN-containing flavoprotein (pyridoxamine 5'-phosphate oxidase superfamily)